MNEGQWIAASALLPSALDPEIALARELAVHAPRKLFDPHEGLRAIQALAANTRRAYGSDWLCFVECCRIYGHSALPATSAALETFIEWRSPEQPRLLEQGMYKYVRMGEARRPASSASLSRALAAIAAVHAWLGFEDPTTVRRVRDTYKINTSGRRVQRHKDPLRWAALEAAFDKLGDDLPALRARALAAIAYSTLFRRAELVSLQVDDYERVLGTDYGRIAVRKTKTEDGTEQKYRHVSAAATAHLDRWTAAARIHSGPLFRGLTAQGRVKETALPAGEVARTFKYLAALAGIKDIQRIAGHSTRIGATHDLKAFGADTLDIMHDGGWKSPMMPKRYLQGYASDEGAMARMARARAQPIK